MPSRPGNSAARSIPSISSCIFSKALADDGILKRRIAIGDPILHDFKNIRNIDAVLTWDGYPVPGVSRVDGNAIETYPNVRRPDWPVAEFIVGNPPFIGGKDLRANLGNSYTETLWAAHPHINESADFVMYWWDHAAEIVAKPKSITRRFGFVTTNSITQVFSRRVIERHLSAKQPLSLLMAIGDHPWTKVTGKDAAVRIAMTVAAPGQHLGTLFEVVSEAALDTDQPEIALTQRAGKIHADLSVGADVTTALELKANDGVCSPGVKLHGAGFIVEPETARALGLGKRPGLERHIRPYRNGRDLMARSRGVMVIDLFGLTDHDVRRQYPEVYQHVLEAVKPARQAQFDKSPTRDAREYVDRWWTFGKPREELRPALDGLPRYIGTVETSKHRVFQFLDGEILPDNMIVATGSNDAYVLGVLSSRLHVVWALRAGGWLGVGNDPRYSKSRCFDPFPFPTPDRDTAEEIRAIAEELDAHRKARQAEHISLTMTDLYNVLEKLRGGMTLDDDDRRIKDQGLVLMLKEYHDRLDAAVARAYGWPIELTDEQILERLVVLNAERAEEERNGRVRWLRPDYQIPRFGSPAEKARFKREQAGEQPTADVGIRPAQGILALPDDLSEMTPRSSDDDATKPKFPTNDEMAETAAVMTALLASPRPLTPTEVARHFKGGTRNERRVRLVLDALSRLGHLSSADGGASYALRRGG